MATLSTSGFMADCNFCYAYDPDLAVWKEFKDSDVNSNATTYSVASTMTATWNGHTVYKGTRTSPASRCLSVAFPVGHRPAVTNTDKTYIFLGMTSIGTPITDGGILFDGVTTIRSATAGGIYSTADGSGNHTQSIATAGSDFMFAFASNRATSKLSVYSAFAGNTSLTVDINNTTGANFTGSITAVGCGFGDASYGYCQMVLALEFNTLVAQSDMESILVDPYGVVFASGGAATKPKYYFLSTQMSNT